MSTWWRPWTSGSSVGRRPWPSATASASRAAPSVLVLAALLTVPGIVSPAGAPAQEAREVDSGSFRITDGGDAAVSEQFAIRREGERWQSAARISPAGGDASVTGSIREFRLQLDAELRPTFFELVDRRAGQHGVVGVRSGNRLQLRSRSEEGERWKELLLEPGLVVIPRGVAHPYHFVVRVLESGSEAPLPAVVPDAGERRTMTVESRSPATVTVGGRELESVLRELRVGEETHRVWTDAEGRVLRVEVPARSWTATRTEVPGGP